MLAVSNLGFCFRIKQAKIFLCCEQQMIISFDWFDFIWFAITTRKIKYDPNIAYFLATIKGTLMQIWKSVYLFVFMEK